MKKAALLAAAGAGGPPSLPTPSSHWDFSDIASLFTDSGGTTPVVADGDHIKFINDSVGSRDMVATGNGTGILYKTAIQNGLSVARMTNAVGNDLASVGALANGFTVLAVAKFASVAQSRRSLFGGNSDSHLGADFTNTSKLGLFETSDHASSHTCDTSWHVFTAIPNGASSKMRVDGAEVYSGNAGSSTWDAPAIGNNGGGAAVMVGDIGEVVLYASVLGAADLNEAEAFLADKWGL